MAINVFHLIAPTKEMKSENNLKLENDIILAVSLP